MKTWVKGARPRTLVAAVCPVLVGTAVAGAEGRVVAWRAGAALVVAVALQIGVNFANDYSDGLRGTDSPARLGPTRLTAAGAARQAAVSRVGPIRAGESVPRSPSE
jgi:1,4-dihydroxy-2-naphthoate octaprenyltransferase